MKKHARSLTQDRVKELFIYNEYTGKLIRRTGISQTKKHDEVGCYSGGYLITSIDNRLYPVHRIVWLYNYGYIPEGCIDHVNRDGTDNRLENLREVSVQCNNRNCGNPQNNSSSIKGVYKFKDNWRSFLNLNNKQIHLGYYKTFDEAVCARLAGEQALDWEGCDSSSPAYQYVQRILHG